MHVRKLFAAAVASLLLAHGAAAQTAPDAGTAGTAATGAPAKGGTTSKKSTTAKKKKKAVKKAKKAPLPPPKTDVDEETRKALEAMQPPPATPPAAAENDPYAGDNDPPALTHTPVAKATRGKPVVISAHATDQSGVFGPVLYLRKKGMGNSDYIALRMSAARGTPGDYSVEIPAPLVSVDALEYYIEAWDNAGNGPARAGTADAPFAIAVAEEKKIVVAPPSTPTPPTNVTVRQKGGPPAITHTAVSQATKGRAIELNARLVGDTGVQGATVMFRHVGEKEYKALPMGNIGGDDYTATVPGGMATSDIEYYLEAFDRYGNGPGRNGAPNVPYTIKVLDAAAGRDLTSRGATPQGPQIVKAPFRPNPGRSAAWLLMGGFVGGLVFAGGEAFGSWQAHNAYTHTLDYEGRNDPELLNKANLYGKRAKIGAIIAGSALVASIVLLVVFPEHPDTITVGSGGDVAVRF